MSESSSGAQVRLNRVSPSYWRVVMNNPPLNLMGPEFLLQFREIMAAIESDELLKVVVFESAVEGRAMSRSKQKSMNQPMYKKRGSSFGRFDDRRHAVIAKTTPMPASAW